jgi:hypothetical protein
MTVTALTKLYCVMNDVIVLTALMNLNVVSVLMSIRCNDDDDDILMIMVIKCVFVALSVRWILLNFKAC